MVEPLRLSVALSCYNARTYLPAQLESILDQTRLPDEVVVGDAGSTDGTMEEVQAALERAAHRAPGIEWRVLEPRRLLLDPNMARIYHACSGDVIVVADHDDVCLPQRLAHVEEVFTRSPDLLFVHSDAEIIDPVGTTTATSMLETQGLTAAERQDYATGRAFAVLVRRFIAHGTTSAFRTSLVRDLPPIPPELHHDAWYALMASAMGGLELDERPGIRYRVHPSNLSGGVRRRSRLEKVRMLLEQGSDRNERLLRRAEATRLGVQHLGDRVPAWVQELAEDNLRFQRRRSSMARQRVRRVPAVARLAVGGDYTRFGRGPKDVLLDLVQPRSSTVSEGGSDPLIDAPG